MTTVSKAKINMQNKEKEIKGRWEGQGQKYKKI